MRPLSGSPWRARLKSRTRIPVPLVIGLVSAAAIAAIWLAVRPATSFSSIAVLPFLAAGSDEQAAYLDAAFGEFLHARLSGLTGIRVAPWETARRFADPTIPPQVVGQELEVEALVTGTWRVEGERLIGTVTLVRTDTGSTVATRPFAGTGEAVMDIQNEILLAVATWLRGELTDEDRSNLLRPAARFAQAYDWYLRGAEALGIGDEISVEIARTRFQKALELDPGLAEAHVGIGSTLTKGYYEGWMGDSALDAAERRFHTALQIQADSISALKGLIRISWHRGQSEECLRQGQRATSLGNGTGNLLALAEAFTLCGLPEDAIPLMRTILTLDPGNQNAYFFLLAALTWGDHHTESIAAVEAHRSRFGEFPELHELMLISHAGLGRSQEAVHHAERMLDGYPPDARNIKFVLAGLAFRRNGDERRARDVLNRAVAETRDELETTPDNTLTRLYLAWALAALDRWDEFDQEAERVRRGAPRNGFLRAELAVIYCSVGDIERCLAELQQALAAGYLPRAEVTYAFAFGDGKLGEAPGYAGFMQEFRRAEAQLRALR